MALPRERGAWDGCGEMPGKGAPPGSRSESGRMGAVEVDAAPASRAGDGTCAPARRGAGEAAPPRAGGIED